MGELDLLGRQPLVFGIDIPTAIGVVADPVVAAQTAEALGFDFVSSNDHLLGEGPRYETWTLLTRLAAATSRVRLAARVLGVHYRHPVLVAKMAETFDRLSDGRLILGLGSGSGKDEYEAMGIETGDARARFAGLEEAIAVIHGLWTTTPFTYPGNRYRVEGATLDPKPAHEIPIWLGTAGPRGLDLLGRSSDGWIPSLGNVSPDRVPAMIDRIRTAAASTGRDPDRIALIYNVVVSFSEPASDVVGGTSEAIAERLIGFLRLGFTGFNFLAFDADREAQVERLAREVVPAVRAAA
jgi:alkanesulfonate monooxygenase SsuD/methylene tetrahydromethanopterin reductase-like flavin-dependent oxidoreductase (luciferase family)